MTKRRLIAFVTMAGLMLALAACRGGGGKNSATKTATSKTPRSTVSGTITPTSTGTGNQTPGSTVSSQDGTAGAAETPPQSSATVVRPTPISGTHTSYRVQYTVASDPANIQALVEQGQHGRLPSRLTVTVGDGAISLESPRPFISATGSIDAGGAFTATGTGNIDPYKNVEATFQGTISNGQLTGTYAIGTNGALPGAKPITYNVTGTSQATGQTPTS